MYKDGFHEPFLDFEKERYKHDIITWINKRLSPEYLRGAKPKALGVISRSKITILSSKKTGRNWFRVIQIAILTMLYLRGFYL